MRTRIRNIISAQTQSRLLWRLAVRARMTVGALPFGPTATAGHSPVPKKSASCVGHRHQHRTSGIGSGTARAMSTSVLASPIFMDHGRQLGRPWLLSSAHRCLLASLIVAAAASTITSSAAAQAAGEVSGVVTAHGRPLAGYCVQIVRIPKADLEVHAITDSGGHFHRGGLPRGIYQVSNGCRADARSPYLIIGSADTSVNLTDGESRTVALHVKVGGAIAGAITDAATGLPANGVCLRESPGSHIGGGFPIVKGRFLATQIPPEPTRLVIIACGAGLKEAYPYATTFWPGVLKLSEAKRVAVSAGKTTRLDAVAVKRTGAIAGRVIRAGSHEPIANLCVEATNHFGPMEPYNYSDVPSGNEAGFLTDSTGAYEIHHIPPGQYQVRLSSFVDDSHDYSTTENVGGCGGPYFNFSDDGLGEVPAEVIVNPQSVTQEINFEAPATWASK